VGEVEGFLSLGCINRKDERLEIRDLAVAGTIPKHQSPISVL